ncbi:MAG: transporter substrate-binding domain-containing protein [Tractidigestivibacter sp.]|uniref:transporter substrate-binding domain-containing protein n=1 Tax=Tractidigestivibacter sp. TaxID=2847320 RepID=UPI003D8DD2A5
MNEKTTRNAARSFSRRDFVRGAFGFAGATFLGFGLAGCSAPDETSSDSTTASDSSGTQISVVVANSNPPYCYVDDNGQPIGYDVDVLKAVDERLDDYSFSIEAMDFSAMITACESGSAPLVSCQLVPNDERRSKFIFCKEPFTLSPLVFAVADPNIKTLDDMAGHSVLTSPQNYEYGMLENYNEKYPDKALVLQTVSNLTPADAFKMVATGQGDSYLCYDGNFDTVNEEAQTGLYKTDVVMCESTYFMFNQSQTDLCNAVNDALVDMKSDGSLGKIAEQDLGTDVFTTYADSLSDNELMNE